MRFDKFNVLKKLGEGGMANVYLIEDKKGEKYALKELKTELLQDSDKIKRFRNESHVIKDFTIDNIIKIYAPSRTFRVYDDDGRNIRKTYAYIMEYVRGKSLKDYLASQKLTILQTNELFTSLLNALDYCHNKGVIHRDIKPANILLRKSNSFKDVLITDFGIAKMNSGLTDTGELTVEITLLGAPAYMSPEQISDSRKVDARSDLYSLGVVFYEVLTGAKPYSGSKWDIIAQHKDPKIKPLPPSKFNSDLDRKLEELVLRLLEKDITKRPQSANDALQLLNDATTRIITQPNSVDWKKYLYKDKTIIQISYRQKNRQLYTQKFFSLPIVIGRESPNDKERTIKYRLPREFRNVSRSHCEIFKNENGELVLRDISRGGTTVNNYALKNDVCHLKKGINELNLANSTHLRLEIVENKVFSPAFYATLSGAFIILIIITILVIFI